MSKLGTSILVIAVLALGAVGAFLGLNAGSQPFAIQMGIFTVGCLIFLLFVLRRAKFDSPQG
jgi:hypothetical protein